MCDYYYYDYQDRIHFFLQSYGLRVLWNQEKKLYESSSLHIYLSISSNSFFAMYKRIAYLTIGNHNGLLKKTINPTNTKYSMFISAIEAKL